MLFLPSRMSRARKAKIGVVAAVLVGAAAVLIIKRVPPRRITSITGAVLQQDADPRKQLPIPNVVVTAEDDVTIATTKSDTSGLFRLNLQTGLWPYASVTLRFQHAGYQPLEMTQEIRTQLYIVHMVPLASATAPPPKTPEMALSDVRVRYAIRTSNTVNIGSSATTFEVVNTGNIPCEGQKPCSPDGKWKASIGAESVDAGAGHQFRNARISCIAGPCPFSAVESNELLNGGRILKVSVRNWSDTVTYLLEAEVIDNMPIDQVLQLYPAIFGRAMNFTLPAGAEGAAVEADLNGTDIVYPIGPSLNLSWASCDLKLAPDRTRAYSCELKPGYRFDTGPAPVASR